MLFGKYTFGVEWHIVLDGGDPDPQRKGKFEGLNPQPKLAIGNL